MNTLKVGTYNIHGCIGKDRRYDPERIAAVLRELDCDILALQELLWNTEEALHLLERLARSLGYLSVAGPTLLGRSGHYGNALLTRLSIDRVHRLDLSVPSREPRGALDVVLEATGSRVRVIATHLGLHPSERRTQVRRLLAGLEGSDTDMPAVLMGDINEWFLWGRPLRWLHRRFSRTPAPATYPAAFPLLALDRIWVHPRHRLVSLRTHRSPLARLASDHLPLQAVVLS